jgi:hypothetical protein
MNFGVLGYSLAKVRGTPVSQLILSGLYPDPVPHQSHCILFASIASSYRCLQRQAGQASKHDEKISFKCIQPSTVKVIAFMAKQWNLLGQTARLQSNNKTKQEPPEALLNNFNQNRQSAS